MQIDDFDIISFLNQVANNVHPGYRKKNFILPLKWEQQGEELNYILDLATGNIIRHSGFKELLGYEERIISPEFLFNNIHPEDGPLVQRITMAAIMHCHENPDREKNYRLSLTYRHKTKAGPYIYVLNQVSVIETDEEGRPIQVLICLKNISFIDTFTSVNWIFEAPNLIPEDFANLVYAPFFNIFSNRELDIIHEMAKGFDNRTIGELLCISMHTVATHRKNIMRKSGCHDLSGLLLFCRKNGILRQIAS